MTALKSIQLFIMFVTIINLLVVTFAVACIRPGGKCKIIEGSEDLCCPGSYCHRNRGSINNGICIAGRS